MFTIIKCLVLLTLIKTLCLCGNNLLDNTELVLAFMVHRHGDRTPIERYMNFTTDPTTVRSLSKKFGSGQLTDAGIRRSYELGKTIRHRYGSYLSPRYKRSEIYIRSTDSTRTKMTILAAMAAVYSVGCDNWSKDINWTPVPYTTVPAIHDFNLATVNCPNLMTDFETALKGPASKLTEKYDRLLNNLAEVTGTNITATPVYSYVLYDVYISQESLGVTLGKELDALMPELAEAAADSMHVLFGDQKSISLQAGVLLNEFFKIADKIISGEDEAKIRVYSAHDVNVYAFTAITRIQPRQGVPKYASMYSLELRKVVATGEYIIVPVYFKEPGVDAVYVTIDGCDDLCTLDSFRNLTADYVLDVDTWRTLCDFSEDYDFDTSSVD